MISLGVISAVNDLETSERRWHLLLYVYEPASSSKVESKFVDEVSSDLVFVVRRTVVMQITLPCYTIELSSEVSVRYP